MADIERSNAPLIRRLRVTRSWALRAAAASSQLCCSVLPALQLHPHSSAAPSLQLCGSVLAALRLRPHSSAAPSSQFCGSVLAALRLRPHSSAAPSSQLCASVLAAPCDAQRRRVKIRVSAPRVTPVSVSLQTAAFQRPVVLRGHSLWCWHQPQGPVAVCKDGQPRWAAQTDGRWCVRGRRCTQTACSPDSPEAKTPRLHWKEQE